MTAPHDLYMKIASVFRSLPRDRPWLGLMVGVAVLVAAAALRWFLDELGEGFGPMPILPAMLLAGLIGGIRVALGFGAVCTLIAWVFFFPPFGTFILSPRDTATMLIFVLTACIELYVIRTLNLAINDLSLARERSNTLFRELQHRVANNLQFVAALLHLRKKALERDSDGARALEAARSRLDLMARVHRRLHDPKAVDLPVGRYLEELCGDLIKASDARNIRLTVEAPPIELDPQSLMSVSLIVAELVTNSLKYAFRGRSEGSIAIRLSARKQVCTLTVADDGCGLPATFSQTRCSGLGQGILQSLAAQLGGTISFERGRGTTARLVFHAQERIADGGEGPGAWNRLCRTSL
jgi:two-component sensor histidine kinase